MKQNNVVNGLKITLTILIVIFVLLLISFISIKVYYKLKNGNINSNNNSKDKIESFKEINNPNYIDIDHIQDINFQQLDSQIMNLLQHGKFQGVDRFYNKESFQKITSAQERKYLNSIINKTDALLDNVIQNPFPQTDPERWKEVKNIYKQNIKGLSFIEQYLLKQFAYTKNKGEVIKLCTNDEDGLLDEDVNMYVLLHEITHIYDKKYLDDFSHDDYFWVIFSKLVKRAVDLDLIDADELQKDQCRCHKDIIKASVDYNAVLIYAQKPVPVELREK